MDAIIFLIFASIAVFCGINVVVRKRPISSALALIGAMGSLSVIYLLLGAQFIAAAQVFVYAGAIMVLFVFVIMLVNAGPEPRSRRQWLPRLVGPLLLATMLFVLAGIMLYSFPRAVGVRFGTFNEGTVEAVGNAVFTTYLLPFEITSILVLIAILGAVVLGYKEMD
jgi:NADH-quinone oxidoreductase subunit J